MLVHVRGQFVHTVLGQTRDDAAGEAFDKVSKMLGLGYPGGPVIDRIARNGNPSAIKFPRSWLEDESCDFSFSGLKTAVLYYLRDLGIAAGTDCSVLLGESKVADIAASFQAAVVDVLATKAIAAAARYGCADITVAGGVSANSALRRRLGNETSSRGMRVHFPKMEYCMDNGAMIAYVGSLKLAAGVRSELDLPVVPNLSLG
jgi:N6-L-threonylcarbamoyladenine synthase